MKLFHKLLIFFLPLSLLSCLAILLLIQGSLHRIVTDEVAKRVFLKTDYGERITAPGIAAQDEKMLLPVLQSLADRVGADYAAALNLQGLAIAHTNVAEKGKLFTDETTRAGMSSESPVVREITDDGKPMLDIALPVHLARQDVSESLLLTGRTSSADGGRVGTLRIGIDLENVLATQKAIIKNMVWILLVTFCVAFVLAVLFLRHILQPVLYLNEATKRVSLGHFGETLPGRAHDELGELTSNFNAMSRQLKIRSGELERQKEELARSNEELEQFAHLASHDLQEPLRMITSYLQLISHEYKGKIDAEADQFIAFAVDGAKRMKDLIDAILAYSKVGSRAQALEPVDFSIPLNHALTNLKIAIRESGAEVTHDPMPVLSADEIQITELFQNLIGNALKFRGTDPLRIHVGARVTGGEHVIFVRDNGIGIDPKYFERIFEIFHRLHPHDKYPGTGIGLALCKKIVERHHGRIWVESQSGKGSTFYFTVGGDLRRVETVPMTALDQESMNGAYGESRELSGSKYDE